MLPEVINFNYNEANLYELLIQLGVTRYDERVFTAELSFSRYTLVI